MQDQTQFPIVFFGLVDSLQKVSFEKYCGADKNVILTYHHQRGPWESHQSVDMIGTVLETPVIRWLHHLYYNLTNINFLDYTYNIEIFTATADPGVPRRWRGREN